jgi:hypothetical protein
VANRTRTHAHVASELAGAVRTGKDVRLRRGRRAVAPGTGTVADPSPGNARAIAARKGRPPRRVCVALPAADRHTFISSPGDLPALCLLDR